MDQQETKHLVKNVDPILTFFVLYFPEDAQGQTDSRRALETILGRTNNLKQAGKLNALRPYGQR